MEDKIPEEVPSSDRKNKTAILGKRSASSEESYASCSDDSVKDYTSQLLCQPTAISSSQKRHKKRKPKDGSGCSISSATSAVEGMEQVELVIDKAVDRNGCPFRYLTERPLKSKLLCRRDVFASVAHSMLPFPAWVYRQYDTVCILHMNSLLGHV